MNVKERLHPPVFMKINKNEIAVDSIYAKESIDTYPIYYLSFYSLNIWPPSTLVYETISLFFQPLSKEQKTLFIINATLRKADKGGFYKLCCSHPLFLLKQSLSIRFFYNKTVLQAYVAILKSNAICDKTIRHLSDIEYKKHFSLRMMPNENDLDFFQRVLGIEYLHYFIDNDANINVFDFECLTRHKKASLQTKNQYIKELVQINPSYVCIKSEKINADLKLGEVYDLKGRHFIVSSIIYEYNIRQSKYLTKIHLQSTLDKSALQYKDSIVELGLIVGQKKTNQYTYQLNHEEIRGTENHETDRLLDYSAQYNSQRYGSLIKGNKVIIIYQDHNPDEPYIAGVIDTIQNSSMIECNNVKGFNFISQKAGRMNLNDNERHNNVSLGSKENQINMKQHEGLLIKSKGHLQFKAPFYQKSALNLLQKATQHLIIKAESKIGYKITEGQLSFDSLESVRHQAKKKYQMKMSHRFILSAKKMMFSSKTILLSGLERAIRVYVHQDRCEIKCHYIDLGGEQLGELGCEQSFIRFRPQAISIKGFVSSQPIKMLGAIIQENLTPVQSEILPQIQYQTVKFPRYYDSFPMNVTFLAWEKKAAQVSEKIVCHFLIHNVSKNVKGEVKIYQYFTESKNTVDLNAVLQKEDTDRRCLISIVPFVTHDDKENKLSVVWKPRNIIECEKLSYFRFQVSLNDITYPTCSNPLQLHEKLEIHCFHYYVPHAILLERNLEHYLYDFEEKEVCEINESYCQFENILLGSEITLYALDKSNHIIEMILGDEGHVYYCYKHEIRLNAKPNIEIKTLPPPFIIDLRSAKEIVYLSKQALGYFDRYCKGITVFIHGYNLPMGHFDRYENSDFIKTVKNAKEIKKTIHGWVMAMEDNLNRANGFDDNYTFFSRCVFVAWSGQPESPIDYYNSVLEAQKVGEALARHIHYIREELPDIKINVIAHSLGGAVLVHGLSALAKHHQDIYVDHVVLIQAAIPSNVFSKETMTTAHLQEDAFYELYKRTSPKYDPWYLPLAEKAAKKITVLYSRNDNIIGRLLEKDEQPKPDNEGKIFNRKPVGELIIAVFLTYLGLDSVYAIANQLGFPAQMMLDEEQIEMAWKTWTAIHYDNLSNLGVIGTLSEQLEKDQEKGILPHYCREISLKIKSHQVRIQEIIQLIRDRWTRFEMKWIYYFIKHIDVVEQVLIEEQYVNSSDKLLTMVERSLSTPILRKELDEIYYSWIEPNLVLIKKIVIFINIAFNQMAIRPIVGMGWGGVDAETVRRLPYKLNNVDTTPWVYHHSDVFSPSTDIMTHVFRAELMAPGKAFHFGIKD